MDYPSQDVGQFIIVFVAVLHSIAVITTCLRLWIRARSHRLWWEDAWAALALCLNVVCAVSTWTLTFPEQYDPWYMSRELHIVSTWLTLLSSTCLLWAVRMSIVFSLIRTIPYGRIRSIASGLAASFLLFWALSIASKTYTCGSNRSWYDTPNFQCPIGLPVSVIEFTTDVISDVTSVALPAWILWATSPPKHERVLVLAIFAMSLLSAIVGMVRVAFLLPVQGYATGITANVEGAVDLMVCNLLVLVTSVYRFFWNGQDIEVTDDIDDTDKDSSVTAKPRDSLSPQTAMDTLTTIDLERLETGSTCSMRSAPTTLPEDVSTCNLSSRPCFGTSVEHVC